MSARTGGRKKASGKAARKASKGKLAAAPGFEFICPRCASKLPADVRVWRCECGAPLSPVMPPFKVSQIDAGCRSVWRYRNLLPMGDHVDLVSLGEGGTPMVDVSLVGLPVHLKLEYLQPTGTHKDRGSAVLATALAASGVRSAVEDSSGNAGASLSAYLARLNVELRVFVPSDTPRSKMRHPAIFGADINNAAESRSEAAAMAQEAASGSAVYASHVFSPFFLAGQATLAYEIWEDLGRSAPDNLVVPVGNGLLLLGLYLGFERLKAARKVKRIPRIFGVQSSLCSPVYDAFNRGATETFPVAPGRTLATGTRVPDPPRGPEILAAIRATEGSMITVSDTELRRGQALAANLGWYVEPTAAVAVAGVIKLDKLIGEGETNCVPLTGSGLKC